MHTLFLFPFTLACALCDLKTKRIPNPLILCGLSGALLTRLFPVFRNLSAPGTLAFLADGCAGFLLPWLILSVPAALKMIGGADVKLLSVIGLQLGAVSCLWLMWHTLIIAAVWSVVLVIRRRNLAERMRYLYRYVGQVMVTGKAAPYRTGLPGGADASGEFCLSVPILLALTVRLSLL